MSETIGQSAQGSAKEKVPNKCGQPQHTDADALGQRQAGFPGGGKGFTADETAHAKAPRPRTAWAGVGNRQGRG